MLRSSLSRSIRWRTGAHLLLIVLLIAANLGGVWWFLQEQEHDGTAINEAGKQRLLIQKMTMEAHMIGIEHETVATGRKTDELRASLAADANEFNRTLTALINGNESMGIPQPPPAVREQLLTVRSEWLPFYAHIRTILQKSPSSQSFTESLAYLETNHDGLLAESDAAVQQYERAFQRKITQLQLFLLGVFGLDLVVIPLLFVLIDRQMLLPIKRIAAQARSIANGDLNQSITVVDSTKEVGELSHALREMHEQLDSAVRDAQQFEQAVEHAGHAIYMTDTDGTIEYVNSAFEEVTGFREEDVVGETPRILKSGHQPNSYYEEMWDTIKSGEIWKDKIVDQRASGELFHAYVTIGPITDESDEVVGFVAILSDLTEQIVSEQQNQVLSRVLRHNLRNDLNLIDGYAQGLLDTDDPELRREYVSNIREHVDGLVSLGATVDKFVRMFRQNNWRQPQRVCLTVERISETMRERYPHATITAETPAYEIEVLTNIDLALEEVVKNAIEHNPRSDPQVTITVTIEHEADPPPIVRIDILDNGPGIPEMEREVIEEGEETPLFHGSGLGLWAIHWTVTLAGGDVTITDRSPQGTRIELRLPRASVSPFPRNLDVEGSSPSEEHTDNNTNEQ